MPEIGVDRGFDPAAVGDQRRAQSRQVGAARIMRRRAIPAMPRAAPRGAGLDREKRMRRDRRSRDVSCMGD
jgi:hypothetical protein